MACVSEVAEADEAREVGWTDPFLLGQCGKRRPVAAREGGVEAVRPDQQLDPPSVGLCGGKRVGPVDSILISCPDGRSRTRGQSQNVIHLDILKQVMDDS